MPWDVKQDPRCPASRPWGVVKQTDGALEGCHDTKASAQDQQAALYASERSSTMPPEMRAIPVHHTATTAEPWDPSVPAIAAVIQPPAAYGWAEEGRSLFLHHHVLDDGALGPAALRACRSSISLLNGGRPGVIVPAGDRAAIWDHLAAHLMDAGETVPELRDWEPPTEERYLPLEDIEIRDADPAAGSPARIVGHAAVFNRWSDDLGGFRERVLTGAFTKTLQEADIRATFNHDPNYVLGRQRAGEGTTLELREVNHGLRTIAYPPDTLWARDLMMSMRRGDIDQMSFTFKAVSEQWSDKANSHGLFERDVAEARLYDVAVVTFPAYPQTDASVRSALARAGIPFDLLAVALDRAGRGAAPTPSETELLRGTIETLQAFIPAAPAQERHAAPAPQAGRSIAHLRRLLELSETE